MRHSLSLILLFVCACDSQTKLPVQHARYGAWGVDLAGQDTSVRAGDDFFNRVNGGWLTRAQIPNDKSSTSLRSLMTDTTEARLRTILETAAAKSSPQPTDLEGKIGAFYKSFMDSAAVEQLGAGALDTQLDQVRSANARGAIAALMGRNVLDFNGTTFSMYVDADLKNPNVYSVFLNQNGLGLPDRDYYLKAEFAAQRDAYRAYVESLLTLIRWPEPTARANDIVAYETAIANVSWTKVQQRDPNAINNPMTIAELGAFAPGFDWNAYISGAGIGKLSRVVVSEKSAFPKIAALFASTPLPVLQAWQAFTIADNAAPYLSTAFADAFFQMRQKTLAGQKVQSARWKRGVHAVSGGDFLSGDRYDRFGTMGFGVGEVFSAKYFPPAAKAKIEELVVNLKSAYRTRIQNLDWMSAPTKEKALRKLDTYTIKVGYPDKKRDYSKLVIRDNDLLGNVLRSAAVDWQLQVDRMNSPVDKSEWFMTPQTNDAYNGSLRDIVFPAGILQPPIFDANADAAINYGAAGGIIGHELTHGFDDQGRQIDADGALRDWWQSTDAKTFDTRAKALAVQYSAFEPLSGLHVNGDLTLGENIADLGGITLALDAYRASLKGQQAPVIDGFTGDQRVFLGWAQAFRGKSSDDLVRKSVASDPHSPRPFRVNGPLRNMDTWYDAFGIKAGDKLYIAPELRVRIW